MLLVNGTHDEEEDADEEDEEDEEVDDKLAATAAAMAAALADLEDLLNLCKSTLKPSLPFRTDPFSLLSLSLRRFMRYAM